MTPEFIISPLYLCLLIDQTGEMGACLDLLERKLQHLLTQLQKEEGGAALQIQVIGMHAATIQLMAFSPVLPFQLPAQGGCDLGTAFKLIDAKIQQLPSARVVIFILLGQEPGGDWQTTLEALGQYPLAQLMLFDFGGAQKVSEPTVAHISRIKGHIHRFSALSTETVTQAFQSITHSIREMITNQVPIWNEAMTPLDEMPDFSQCVVISTPTDVVTRPAIITGQGVATGWKEIEPDPTSPFAVAHYAQEMIAGPAGWRLIGASRRGKMHAHKGSFREDAFALGVSEAWQCMIVADGGGSCPLARLGAKLVTAVGMSAMQRTVQQQTKSTANDELCRQALTHAIVEVCLALEEKAQTLQVPLGHLGTTFLAVMFHAEQRVVGVAQIGDGLLAAEMADGTTVVLAEPDVGPTASATWFLTSKPWQEWQNRVVVQQLAHPPRLLAAMCDGVADDFIPYDQYLQVLFANLKQQVIDTAEPAATLLDLLGYEKRGSFDDRTLTLIYQGDGQADESSAAAASTRKPELLAVTLLKAAHDRA